MRGGDPLLLGSCGHEPVWSETGRAGSGPDSARESISLRVANAGASRPAVRFQSSSGLLRQNSVVLRVPSA
jgi:hypothetical protein